MRFELVDTFNRFSDLRAHAKVREFLLQWLKVDHAPEVAKDPGRFPGFDQAAVADLRTSLDLFLDEIVNLPMTTQSKLLRVLQERQVQVLGGRRAVPVDVRKTRRTSWSSIAPTEARSISFARHRLGLRR